jgi:hypothetical protein
MSKGFYYKAEKRSLNGDEQVDRTRSLSVDGDFINYAERDNVSGQQRDVEIPVENANELLINKYMRLFNGGGDGDDYYHSLRREFNVDEYSPINNFNIFSRNPNRFNRDAFFKGLFGESVGADDSKNRIVSKIARAESSGRKRTAKNRVRKNTSGKIKRKPKYTARRK